MVSVVVWVGAVFLVRECQASSFCLAGDLSQYLLNHLCRKFQQCMCALEHGTLQQFQHYVIAVYSVWYVGKLNTAMRAYRRLRQKSQHQVEVSGYLHATITLPSGKDSLVPVGLEAGWAPVLVWLVWKRKNSDPPPISWDMQRMFTVLTELMQLLHSDEVPKLL
jgi:hypothetical protein